MHFLISIIAALAALVGVVSPSPILGERQTTVAQPARYYLRTKVYGTHKDTGTNKTNLWVYSYHTGAGLGAAALDKNKNIAMEAYSNGTQLLFTYPGNEVGGWPLSIEYGPYQQWSTVDISIAVTPQPFQGFFFNSTGLQYNGSIAGWLACDWAFSVPQLFNQNGYHRGPIPSSCSRVHLFPVAV